MVVMRTRYARTMLLGVGIALCASPVLVYAANKDKHRNYDSLEDYLNLSLTELAQVKVFIATGNGTPLDKAPATAIVINAAEIEMMGAKNLNEILESVPGLHISLSSLS